VIAGLCQRVWEQLVQLLPLPRWSRRLPRRTHFGSLSGDQRQYLSPMRVETLQRNERSDTDNDKTQASAPLKNFSHGLHIAPLTCKLGSTKDERITATLSMGTKLAISSIYPHLVYQLSSGAVVRGAPVQFSNNAWKNAHA
jgi:hypothetical protein